VLDERREVAPRTRGALRQLGRVRESRRPETSGAAVEVLTT
jgi:hypothetical protein